MTPTCDRVLYFGNEVLSDGDTPETNFGEVARHNNITNTITDHCDEFLLQRILQKFGTKDYSDSDAPYFVGE